MTGATPADAARAAPAIDDPHPRVPDPSIPNRMVSSKPANRPFLAHKEYRDRQEALHNAWLERKNERDEKLARGEKVGPEERDPTGEEEVGLLGLLKLILGLVFVVLLAGKFFTGSYMWDYDGKWIQLKSYLPETNQRLFSERHLAEFDGSTPDTPIYLAIDHVVYDVSGNRATYGPGGSYHLMAGVDAARSFGTGCFREHRTHDLRGLTEAELESVDHWKKFFAEHKKYNKVGKVIHPPIDPASPIPDPCDTKKRKEKPSKESQAGPHPKPTGNKDPLHEEL